MNLNKIFSKIKKNLTHGSHGGEIYTINNIEYPESLLDFSTNINPLFTPDAFFKKIQNSMIQVQKYPDSNSTQLKQELVNYFNDRIGLDNILIGAGSMEIISIFCDMVINPSDEVIISQPTFSEYAWSIEKNGGKIIHVFRKPEKNFRIKSNPILDLISAKTRAIFICNPNNPNGLLDNFKDIEEIINIASKHDVLIFLDEAFIEFTGEPNSFVNKISLFDNLFVCRTFTKFFGLAGLRVGYGISTPEIIEYMSRGQLLWSVNCIGQSLAQQLLKSKSFVEESIEFISNERKFVINEIEKIPNLKIFPSDTNFLLINTAKTGITSAKLKKLMLKDDILIRDCSNYYGLDEYYIRVSIKTREQNLKMINSLKEIIELN